jgi:hypothetical protein
MPDRNCPDLPDVLPGLRPGLVSKPSNTSGGKLANAAAIIIS